MDFKTWYRIGKQPGTVTPTPPHCSTVNPNPNPKVSPWENARRSSTCPAPPQALAWLSPAHQPQPTSTNVPTEARTGCKSVSRQPHRTVSAVLTPNLLGTYTAGPPRANGNWTALLPEVKIDAGNSYASKDFYGQCHFIDY